MSNRENGGIKPHIPLPTNIKAKTKPGKGFDQSDTVAIISNKQTGSFLHKARNTIYLKYTLIETKIIFFVH